MRCLTSARFTMQAELLRRMTDEDYQNHPVPDETTPGGYWNTGQDPITGELLNDWVPASDSNTDDPTTPVYDPQTRTISCLARGVVDGGIRVAGTTERFGDMYENIEYVKMWVPARTLITKRDRVTNIRAQRGGRVIWLDEEYEGGTRPTIFNVQGVAPLFDAFNKHTENFVLLEKVEGDGS